MFNNTPKIRLLVAFLFSIISIGIVVTGTPLSHTIETTEWVEPFKKKNYNYVSINKINFKNSSIKSSHLLFQNSLLSYNLKHSNHTEKSLKLSKKLRWKKPFILPYFLSQIYSPTKKENEYSSFI